MGKFWNSVGNTAGLVPRTAGATGLLALDTVKTGANILTDAGHVAIDTSDKLWEVLSSSRNTGKWYNKLYQVPAGAVIGAGTLIEGVVRLVVEPTRNAFLNVRDTAGNFFVNIGNTLKQAFKTDKPVSDFRFEKIQTKTTSNKNWFSKLAWWKKGNTVPQTPQKSNTAPQTSNTAPQTSNTAPQTSNTAPQTSNTAPQVTINQITGFRNQVTNLSSKLKEIEAQLATLIQQNPDLINQNQQLINQNQQLINHAQSNQNQTP